MKTLRTLSVLALVTSASAAEPQVNALEAAQIAQDYLRKGGHSPRHYIASVVLEKSSLTSKTVYWNVRWEPSIDRGERKELGLEVAMDGTISRRVSKTAEEQRRDKLQKPSVRDTFR